MRLRRLAAWLTISLIFLLPIHGIADKYVPSQEAFFQRALQKCANVDSLVSCYNDRGHHRGRKIRARGVFNDASHKAEEKFLGKCAHALHLRVISPSLDSLGFVYLCAHSRTPSHNGSVQQNTTSKLRASFERMLGHLSLYRALVMVLISEEQDEVTPDRLWHIEIRASAPENTSSQMFTANLENSGGYHRLVPTIFDLLRLPLPTASIRANSSAAP